MTSRLSALLSAWVEIRALIEWQIHRMLPKRGGCSER